MTSFSVKDKVALVTGANRENGIGRAIVMALLDAGVKSVYATARDPASLENLMYETKGQVMAVDLDVESIDSVKELPNKCPDVDLIVNNAGFMVSQSSLDSIPDAQREIDVNYVGPLAVVSLMAPVLQSKNEKYEGEGKATAIVNINSIASFVNFPLGATYSATKAAAHSLTQAQRRDLPDSLVVGVYPGPIDTDLAKTVNLTKSSPKVVADAVLVALKEGKEESFPDDMAKSVFSKWQEDFKEAENEMAQSQ